jgi:cytochrome P450
MTSAQTASSLNDDPFGAEILADPYPFHQRLREAGPVVQLSHYERLVGIGRYAEVRASLTDWETFVSSRGAGLPDFAREKPWRRPSLVQEPTLRTTPAFVPQ